VITPVSAHHQVPGREAFLLEPQTPGQTDRATVGWLDVCLHPVQAQLAEHGAEHGTQALGHQTPASVRSESGIAQEARLEGAAHDVIDAHIADEFCTRMVTYQVGSLILASRPIQVGREAPGRIRRVNPRPVQRPAPLHSLNKLPSVGSVRYRHCHIHAHSLQQRGSGAPSVYYPRATRRRTALHQPTTCAEQATQARRTSTGRSRAGSRGPGMRQGRPDRSPLPGAR
jgi:hypothetical protein